MGIIAPELGMRIILILPYIFPEILYGASNQTSLTRIGALDMIWDNWDGGGNEKTIYGASFCLCTLFYI